jgi:hypothetical protein
MLNQLNLFNMNKFTSSPESGSGATHSETPDGRTIDPSLPDHAHANPSHQPAKKTEQKTSDTSGPKCFDSSPVYQRAKDRQQYLVSRLQTRNLGSTLYKMTWREKTTPQGWSFFRLVSSAHRTSGKDSTGLPTTWTTPVARGGNLEEGERFWREAKRQTEAGRPNLLYQVSLTVWNTPNAMDGNRGPCAITMDESGNAQRISQTTGTKFGMSLVTQSQLTGWSSPTASTGGPSKNPDNPRGANAGNPLATSATLTGWPTATVRDHKDTGKNLSNSNTRKDGKSRLHSVPRVATLTGPARLTATGEMQIGSGAEIKNGGQLNPALSRWLMGLPPEWCDSAVTATPSSRPRRKHS